ncbi:MAG: hypothetical protein ABTQ34_00475 [Bdellovibrionales bacterium]
MEIEGNPNQITLRSYQARRDWMPTFVGMTLTAMLVFMLKQRVSVLIRLA